MHKHIKTIRGQLFIYYSTLVALLFIASTTVVYLYVTNVLTRRAEESLSQMVRSLSTEIDARLREMNEISVRVAYSNLIKARFESYRSDPEPVSSYYDQQALRDIFIAIMGPLRSVLQLNLYDFEGTVVGAGHRNFTKTIDVRNESWFAETMRLEGSRYTTIPYVDEETERLVVGLCRVYYDDANRPVGMIETLQDYHELLASVESFHTEPPSGYDGSRVYVMDGRRRIVFPVAFDRTEDDTAFIRKILEVVNDPPIVNPYRLGQSVAAYSTSEYSGWTVIISQPMRNLRLRVLSFSRLILILLATSLGLALAASFLLARRLALPIDRIHTAVRTVDIDSPFHEESGSLDSEFNELEDLYESFKQMSARLRRSTAALVEAKSQEMNARLLALQSQMNPHFLYNTLSTISILAEERETDDIVSICDHMSSMLRYIASDATDLVPLRTEVEHTVRYLELMRYRYEENLEYHVEIPENMLDIPVPKLIVQPLIENSMKYGIHTPPPWKLRVRGGVVDGGWTVEVTDDGTGFAEEKLIDIRETVERLNSGDMVGELRVEGMGLLNILSRLRLLYADRTVFHIGNGANGGAAVLIGGPIESGVLHA